MALSGRHRASTPRNLTSHAHKSAAREGLARSADPQRPLLVSAHRVGSPLRSVPNEAADRVRPFDASEFRTALGAFVTGVTVITTRSDISSYGVTANAFSSVSLEPPLILVCIKAASGGSREIVGNSSFAVNILSADQEAISRFFASSDRPRGPDALQDVPHRLAASGSPILDGVAAYLDCRLVASHAAGDHMIFVGEVTDLAVGPDVSPLLFHAGQYRRVA